MVRSLPVMFFMEATRDLDTQPDTDTPISFPPLTWSDTWKLCLRIRITCSCKRTVKGSVEIADSASLQNNRMTSW